LEKTVRDAVHRAFWDTLEEQLAQNPPQYERAISLLSEIKETLLSLMLPHHKKLKDQINEVLDMELIKQEISHGCFDMDECTKFIIVIMGKLCAPLRDEKLKELKNHTGIASTLRGILEFLDLMKLDMANFQLQKVKPILMQQAVEYERGKFEEFLKINPDGTVLTRHWLRLAICELKQLISKSFNRIKGSSNRPQPKISTTIVLTHAYLKLLDWQDSIGFPETLLLDELRLAEMSHMFSRLCLIGSLMLLTSNLIGSHLATNSSFIRKLKDHLFVLLDGVRSRNLHYHLPNLYEQVVIETKKACEETGVSYLEDAKEATLKSQIGSILNEENSVHSLVKSRIRDYVLLCMTSEKSPKQNEAPLALVNIQDELKMLSMRFSRIVSHNRNVYLPFYNDMIKQMLDEMDEGEKENELGTSSGKGDSFTESVN